jgi:hypothetical protein
MSKPPIPNPNPAFTMLKEGDANPLGFYQWARQHMGELTKWSAKVNGALPPTGARMPWHAGVAPPTGWLAEDGAIMNVSDYPALYVAIRNTYGGNNTVFQLPKSATPMIIKY